MSEDFKDRYGPVALVTGASSGIGETFAEALAAEGPDLVLVVRRIDRLDALAARLSATNGIAAHCLQVDLALPDAAEQMLAATATATATATVDVGLVVSNAGFSMKGEHAANDPAAMAEMLMVNCHVPM